MRQTPDGSFVDTDTVKDFKEYPKKVSQNEVLKKCKNVSITHVVIKKKVVESG